MYKKTQPERAIVLGVHTPKNTKHESYESYLEAKNLISTAGAEMVDADVVEVRQFSPSTFFGSGKVDEIRQKICILKPDIIVIDHHLSPVQNRNLEEAWKVRVLDRTGLILDIFALRAHSKEGQLQVELAQYEYLLPRLVGAWTHLSKQKGGIGLRGPGETQLEVDRRRARERISMIKKNLKKVSSTRELHREKRQSVPLPTVSLIGYTNAGKSTLFKSLTGSSDVIAEDKLFATLDPKTGKIRLPSGQKILVSDTVGFIRNLPHELIESFKSTFQEVADSDVLIHVIDASHPDRAQQIETVENIVRELNMHHKPMIRVMNKIDRIEIDLFENSAMNGVGNVVKISALENFGIENLLEKIEDVLSEHFYRRVHLLVPHTDGRVLNEIYTHGCVHSNRNTAYGTEIDVDLPPKWQNMYKRFVIDRPVVETAYV